MKHLRLAAAAIAATLLLAACADAGSITAPTRANIDAHRRSTDAAADSTTRDGGGMYGGGLRTTSASQDGGGMYGGGGQTLVEAANPTPQDGGGMAGGGG